MVCMNFFFVHVPFLRLTQVFLNFFIIAFEVLYTCLPFMFAHLFFLLFYICRFCCTRVIGFHWSFFISQIEFAPTLSIYVMRLYYSGLLLYELRT